MVDLGEGFSDGTFWSDGTGWVEGNAFEGGFDVSFFLDQPMNQGFAAGFGMVSGFAPGFSLDSFREEPGT